MKLFAPFLSFVLCIGAAPAITIANEKGVYVFPQAAAPEYSKASDLQSDGLWGAGAGYRFDGPVALEADFLTGDTKPKAGLGDLDVDVWSIRALYHFLETDTLHPYVSAGFGQQDVDYRGAGTEEQINAGIGLRWNIWKKLDGRAAFNFYDGNREGILKRSFNVGLLYRLGAIETPTPEPVDSDGDGVMDSQDSCLGTPPGASVDARGCQIRLDSDGDGVSDAQDRCPGTTNRDRKVDAQGCYVPVEEMVFDTITMEVTFLFDFDSAAINDEHRTSVQEIARFAQGGKDTLISLAGHTDSSGSDDYNQKLSEQRAAAIKELLVETLQVTADDIGVTAFGETRLTQPRETADNRQLNRLVVATVTTTRTRLR